MSEKERERKFVVDDASALASFPSTRFVQGYLVVTPSVELRVRTGPGQVITVKGGGVGFERDEEEFVMEDRHLAYALIEACNGRVLVKTRYVLDLRAQDGDIDHWTIDEYHGDNEGLVVAEYEYRKGEDANREPERPDWIGREVTHLSRYYAQNLSIYPYREWTQEEKEE